MSTLSKTTTVSMWFAPVKSTYAVAASPRTRQHPAASSASRSCVSAGNPHDT